MAESVMAQGNGRGNGNGGGGGGGGLSFEILALDDGGGFFVDTIARGVNNLSEIVGQAEDAAGYDAVYWTIDTVSGSTTTQISLLASGSADSLAANDINDNSEIVGTGDDALGNNFGLYWTSPTAVPIPLPPLPGDESSFARGISNDGVIIGSSTRDEPSGPVSQAVAWRAFFDQASQSMIVSGPVLLPTLVGDSGTPESINDNDANGIATIVGTVESAGGSTQTAVSWTVESHADGTLTADPTTNVLDLNASAHGLNNAGAISGRIDDEPVVWTSGSPQTLKRAKFFFDTTAKDINSNGVIAGYGWYQKGFQTGYRAVAWADVGGSMIVLNKSLSSNSPFLNLDFSMDINDQNAIVGYGWDGTFIRAFLAVPD